jgi:hypothetical protein
MKRSGKIITATLLFLGATGSVLAFGARNHSANMDIQEKADMFNYYVSRKLDLNTVQEVNLEALSSRFAQVMQQVKQQHEEQSQLLDQLLADGPLDQALLLSKISEKTARVDQYAPEMVGLIAQFVDSLDSGQKLQLKQIIQQRHSRHHYDGLFRQPGDAEPRIDG